MSNLKITNKPKLVFPKGNITPILLDYSQLHNTCETDSSIKKGDMYQLQGTTCEGFEMPTRIYICKEIIDTIGGLNLDSVVMKQIDGPVDSIFSLTKTDCKMLGVEYEEKLQLFPKSLDWQIVKKEPTQRLFAVDNLGTYIPSPIDGTIRQMHIFMGNLYMPSLKKVVLPNGADMSLDKFIQQIKICFKDRELACRFPIIVKPLLYDGRNLYDGKNRGINFMLAFTVTPTYSGIDTQVFEGKTFDDVFEIYWPLTKETWIKSEAELNKAHQTLWQLTTV